MATKEISIEHLTAIVDHREKLPYNLFPMTEEQAELKCGDYSIKGLERYISVERKSGSDYLMCVGQERERFDHERQRMMAYPHRLLVIEATWPDIISGAALLYGRSKVHPHAAAGLIQRWMCDGIPVFLAGTREAAERYVLRFLFMAARTRWDEAVALLPNLKVESIKKTKEKAG